MINNQKFKDINKVVCGYIDFDPFDKKRVKPRELLNILLSLKLMQLCSPDEYSYAYLCEDFLRKIKKRLQVHEL